MSSYGHQSASPDGAQIHRLVLGLLGLGLALQLERALLHLDHPRTQLGPDALREPEVGVQLGRCPPLARSSSSSSCS